MKIFRYWSIGFLLLFAVLNSAQGTDQKLFSSPGWVVVPASQLEQYSDLWFISDVHGRLNKLTNFLFKAGLTSDATAQASWKAKRALFVVVGDYIDGGDQSAEVMDFLSGLLRQAPNFQSRIIALMGNHEAEFLARSSPADLAPETANSFAHYLNLEDPSKLTDDLIRDSLAAQFAAQTSLGAVIGNWLVAHSGYLDTSENGLPKFISDISAAWSNRDYKKLFSEDGSHLASLLSRHDWWNDNHAEMHRLLKALDLTGLIVGHEPKLLDERLQAAINHGGWFLKIDASMKKDAEGRMVHCQVKDLNQGFSACRQLRASGVEEAIPVKAKNDD